MIRHSQPSPREALAASLDGELMGRESILVGDHVVWATVKGNLRVDNIREPIGKWSDPTEQLAAKFREVVGVSA